MYQLLVDNDMSAYYAFTTGERITPKAAQHARYDFLDEPAFQKRFIRFSMNGIHRVVLFLPQIHCSACIWLLENLPKLDGGVVACRINFLRREATIEYDERRTSLRKVAELVAAMGYEPDFSDRSDDHPVAAAVSRSLYVKLGIAGFAFGNIMLISLPEYLSGGDLDESFRSFFGYVSMILSLPVLYSLSDYFRSAYVSLKQRTITMDVPVSIGVLTLASKSLYDILSRTGPGYLDSLAGLAFFLLLGKVFQKKTFYSLSFDRDYKAYFPIATIRMVGDTEQTIPLEDVTVGDVLVVRHGELVPADSVLKDREALVDYSFVTGESESVVRREGEMIYAGGRIAGGLVHVEVIQPVSQSYLTQLWNQDVFKQPVRSRITTISETTAKYFTLSILLIAAGTAVAWYLATGAVSVHAFASVLIVACGCGLPLSVPFTLGTALRVMEKNRLYLRNDQVVERMALVNTIVFDKTGTLTASGGGSIELDGDPLSEEESASFKSLLRQSTHPMSRQVCDAIEAAATFPVTDFSETPGHGVEGLVNGHRWRAGSRGWVGADGGENRYSFQAGGGVWIAVDGRVRGVFRVVSSYRDEVAELGRTLTSVYDVAVLSGDRDHERPLLERHFGRTIAMRFNQLPFDKLDFIRDLQGKGRRVMMIGDGLNDAGALKQSDVGIAMAEDTASFTPSSDAILDVRSFGRLPAFVRLARASRSIVYAAFVLVLVYNLVAVGLAVQGRLTPVAAAIIMPISATSVVAFTYGAVSFMARRLGLE